MSHQTKTWFQKTEPFLCPNATRKMEIKEKKRVCFTLFLVDQVDQMKVEPALLCQLFPCNPGEIDAWTLQLKRENSHQV